MSFMSVIKIWNDKKVSKHAPLKMPTNKTITIQRIVENVNVIISTYGEDESGPMGNIMVRTHTSDMKLYCVVNGGLWGEIMHHSDWLMDKQTHHLRPKGLTVYTGGWHFEIERCFLLMWNTRQINFCVFSDWSCGRYSGFRFWSARLGIHPQAVRWDVCVQVCCQRWKSDERSRALQESRGHDEETLGWQVSCNKHYYDHTF